jgi:hypothetical protein
MSLSFFRHLEIMINLVVTPDLIITSSQNLLIRFFLPKRVKSFVAESDGLMATDYVMRLGPPRLPITSASI